MGWCPRTAAIMSAVLPLGSVASTCAASSSSSELWREGGNKTNAGEIEREIDTREKARDTEQERAREREKESKKAREQDSERERILFI